MAYTLKNSSVPVSGSPILSDSSFETAARSHSGTPMTVSGVLNKTFIMFGVLLVAMFTMFVMFPNDIKLALNASIVSAIVGMVLSLIVTFKQDMAKILALPFAACEGVFLWGIVEFAESFFPGTAIKALVATVAVVGSTVVMYKTGIIRVGSTFMRVFKGMVVGVIVLVILSLVTRFFMPAAFNSVFSLTSSGWIGVGVSVFIIAFGVMSLIVDLDFAENGEQAKLPADYEWFIAFGLLLSVVTIYVEMLKLMIRLYMMFNDRD